MGLGEGFVPEYRARKSDRDGRVLPSRSLPPHESDHFLGRQPGTRREEKRLPAAAREDLDVSPTDVDDQNSDGLAFHVYPSRGRSGGIGPELNCPGLPFEPRYPPVGSNDRAADWRSVTGIPGGPHHGNPSDSLATLPP